MTRRSSGIDDGNGRLTIPQPVRPPAGQPFRLHLRHRMFNGWVTADGEAVAIEDQELGLTAASATLDDLIRGYGGGRIEWRLPRAQHAEPPEQHDGGRQR
ncbi:hypothetical protein JHN63_02050 [Streptomyces sp. MBT65]|uniref:hypothetical protein n=1 Tax=Streptomyces sp. MBT65 TaxID=1488395 RepID=UPI00190A3F1E|nr:hypothetical protein [Streptomyces sp. MBT65]MBK3572624.1 hypothetical protein [Streptomyces sp. MBT65]